MSTDSLILQISYVAYMWHAPMQQGTSRMGLFQDMGN